MTVVRAGVGDGVAAGAGVGVGDCVGSEINVGDAAGEGVGAGEAVDTAVGSRVGLATVLTTGPGAGLSGGCKSRHPPNERTQMPRRPRH